MTNHGSTPIRALIARERERAQARQRAMDGEIERMRARALREGERPPAGTQPVTGEDLAVAKAAYPEMVIGDARWYGNRLCLSDAQGRACRFADYGPTPRGVLRPRERERDGLTRDKIRDLKDERDMRWKHRVAGFLVQSARLVVRGHAQYETSAVLRRPDVAEPFELESDALAPMLPGHDNAVHHGHTPADELEGIIEPRERERLGVLGVWTDEGRAYQAVLSPRPYESRPERAVVLDDALWKLIAEPLAEFFPDQCKDFVCLHLIRDDMNPDGPMFKPFRGRIGLGEAEQILQRLEQTHTN